MNKRTNRANRYPAYRVIYTQGLKEINGNMVPNVERKVVGHPLPNMRHGKNSHPNDFLNKRCKL